MRDFAIDIAEPVPFVVPAVEPHRHATTRRQVLREHLHGLLAVGRMMQDPDAVNVIEALWGEGQRENIGLECNEWAFSKIARGHSCSLTEIDSHHVGAPACGHLREAAHPTPDVKHKFAFQFFRRKARPLMEGGFRFLVVLSIQLGSTIQLPLETEGVGVIAGIHEARHIVDHRKSTATLGASVASTAVLAQALHAKWTT